MQIGGGDGNSVMTFQEMSCILCARGPINSSFLEIRVSRVSCILASSTTRIQMSVLFLFAYANDNTS